MISKLMCLDLYNMKLKTILAYLIAPNISPLVLVLFEQDFNVYLPSYFAYLFFSYIYCIPLGLLLHFILYKLKKENLLFYALGGFILGNSLVLAFHLPYMYIDKFSFSYMLIIGTTGCFIASLFYLIKGKSKQT